MGLYNSKLFDGSSRHELWRNVPEKEVLNWVRRAVFFTEGVAFVSHFFRTYHTVFLDKCPHCNGAGIMTCPHCQGSKVRSLPAHSFHLSPNASLAEKFALSSATHDCKHCGDFCPWDDESEWHESWQRWESILAYYDQTYSPLLMEWKQTLNGELDEEKDTEDPPENKIDASETGRVAELFRRFEKDPLRYKTLLERAGHPYDTGEVLPFHKVIQPDPASPANMVNALFNMRRMRYDLPPELDPERFPELLLMENGPMQQLDREVEAELRIMKNLDAAMRDAPKPTVFAPTAGTVLCPNCKGSPWHYSVFPNIPKLLGEEPSFMMRTLQRMNPYWTSDLSGFGAHGLVHVDPSRISEYPRQPLLSDGVKQHVAENLTVPASVRPRHERELIHMLNNPGAHVGGWMSNFGKDPVLTPPSDEYDVLNVEDMRVPLSAEEVDEKLKHPLLGRKALVPYVGKLEVDEDQRAADMAAFDKWLEKHSMANKY